MPTVITLQPIQKRRAFPIFKACLKMLTTLTVLGIIPYGWIFAAPLFFTYAITKREMLYHRIKRNTFARMIVITLFGPWLRLRNKIYPSFDMNINSSLSDLLGEELAKLMSYHPIAWLKALFTLLTMIFVPMPFGLLVIYGLYAYSSEDWRDKFFSMFNVINNFVLTTVKKLFEKISFRARLILGIFATITACVFIEFGGLGVFLVLGMSASVIMAILIGISASWKGIKNAIWNFPATITGNVGKVWGIFEGRSWAYFLHKGHVTGNLGPASGQVYSSNIASSVLSPFANPWGGKFAFFEWGSWLLGFNHLGQRIELFFRNIFSSLLFTHEMLVQGDFTGVIGPTSFQIFSHMVLGYYLGSAVDSVIDDFFDEIPRAFENKLKQDSFYQEMYDFAQVIKWPATFTCVATPLLLISPGGAGLIAFAGGGILGGSLLALSGISLGIGVCFALKYAVQQSFYPKPPIVLSPPVQNAVHQPVQPLMAVLCALKEPIVIAPLQPFIPPTDAAPSPQLPGDRIVAAVLNDYSREKSTPAAPVESDNSKRHGMSLRTRTQRK